MNTNIRSLQIYSLVKNKNIGMLENINLLPVYLNNANKELIHFDSDTNWLYPPFH